MLETLTPAVEMDWSVRAGALEWSCRETAAHVAHDLLAYAVQVAAESTESYLPLDLVMRPTASMEQVLAAVRACGMLLADSLTQHPDAVAWHWGLADASAFAAMGVGEVLVHTDDITTGLGIEWSPPSDLADLVVRRVLPGTPPGPPPDVLLWATGRRDLAGTPARTQWVWRAAR